MVKNVYFPGIYKVCNVVQFEWIHGALQRPHHVREQPVFEDSGSGRIWDLAQLSSLGALDVFSVDLNDMTDAITHFCPRKSPFSFQHLYDMLMMKHVNDNHTVFYFQDFSAVFFSLCVECSCVNLIYGKAREQMHCDAAVNQANQTHGAHKIETVLFGNVGQGVVLSTLWSKCIYWRPPCPYTLTD